MQIPILSSNIGPSPCTRGVQWRVHGHAMHELSIALSMIDVAAEEAQRQGGGRVVALTSSSAPYRVLSPMRFGGMGTRL